MAADDRTFMTLPTTTVGIVGATGVLGRHSVPRLVERGYSIHCLVRNERSTSILERMGAKAFRGDIFHPETLAALLEGCDVAMHLATAVPRPGERLDWSTNDRIRREGTHNLLQASKAAGVKNYIQQSIAMLQIGSGDDWSDETVNPTTTPVTQSAWEMEQAVQNSSLDWLILRGGLFYGEGTGRDAGWREAARCGRLKVPGNGEDYVSLIHVSDMAEAVVEAVGGPRGKVFAVVDDRPVRYSELFSYIAAIEHAPAPQCGGPHLLGSFRVPNRAIKAAMQWKPHYRSIFSGLCPHPKDELKINAHA